MVKRKYGTGKTERVGVRISQAAKNGLFQQAELLGISTSELVERIGTGEIRLTVEMVQGESLAS